MKNIKITIITICYNCVNEIEKTILSVISQTYTNIEYIIIDGLSTDGTIEIVNKYKPRIAYYISEKDRGIYDAMNKGILAASGDYLIFMNAGDSFVNNKILENVANSVDFNEDIIYGSINKCLYDCYYEYKPFPLNEMKWHMILPHQGAFIKTSFHKSHPFDISYKSSGDYHFFYNAYYKYHATFKQIDFVIADFEDEHGMSKDNFKRARLEDLRIWGKEKDVFFLIKTYAWFAFRDFKNLIKNYVSEERRISLRNLQLRKQGYKLIFK